MLRINILCIYIYIHMFSACLILLFVVFILKVNIDRSFIELVEEAETLLGFKEAH